jgi:hypothetical protein
MKLKYTGTPTDLGGTAVPGCGTIHISEIKETLTKLSNDLEMPFDFNDYIVGSAGKREYSGDIDLVLDDARWDYGVTAFRENLEEVFGKDNVARNGDMLHLKYPVVMYEEDLQEAQPRTGFVQIDFMFGNSVWKKFYHYADENSEYKGAHRNLMLAAITSELNTYPHIDLNDLCPTVRESDRPAGIIRWKWGSNGLIQVNRHSVKDKHGHWKKKQEDTVIAGPYTDPKTIAGILFPSAQNEDVFKSMESLMIAVKENYGMVDCERVWRRSARNFYDWPQGKLFEYPSEIATYLPPNDK